MIESRGHARLTVTNHVADDELVAEVFYVDPSGEVDGAPLRAQPLAAGVTLCLSLARGQVLVVRRPADAPAAQSSEEVA